MNLTKTIRVFSIIGIALISSKLTQGDPLHSGLKVYQNKVLGFQFKYPEKLTIKKKEGAVHLYHEIPWVHDFPCNFSDGDIAPLKELTDFSMSLKVQREPLKKVIEKRVYGTPVEFEGDLPKERGLGWFGDYHVGPLKGYDLQNGVEGCGFWEYYFPIDKNLVLIVTRGMITELSGISGQADLARKLPAVILPEEEEKIFQGILKSFQLK